MTARNTTELVRVAFLGDGRHCGKGEGYGDLEFAILCELGHSTVPVATTVHDCRWSSPFLAIRPVSRLSVIARPAHTIRIKQPGNRVVGFEMAVSSRFMERRPSTRP